MIVRRVLLSILVFLLPQIALAETGPCFEWAKWKISGTASEADDATALKARIATLEACVLELVTEHAEISEEGDDAPPEKSAQTNTDSGTGRDPVVSEIKPLSTANRVRAPFEVVDEVGRVIFTVYSENGRPGIIVGHPDAAFIDIGLSESGPAIALYDGADVVASLSNDGVSGGYNLQIGSEQEGRTYVGKSPLGSGFYFVHGSGSAGVGTFADRPTGLRVLNSDGVFASGVGLNPSFPSGGIVVVASNANNVGLMAGGPGGGAVEVLPSTGSDARASINCADAGGGKCIAGVRNAAGISVARLQESSNSGGNVTVTDPGGDGVFSAGAANDGGGEACLNRVTGGGEARNVCLGIELPSMGLGK